MTAEDIYTAAEELEARGIDASANPDLVEALAEYCNPKEIAMGNKTRFTLYVPVSYNDGRTVPNRWVVDFEAELAYEFGGFTRTDSIGAWVAPDGRLVWEPVRLYACDIDNSAADFAAEKVRRFAGRIKHDLEQEMVYTTRETISVQTY